MAYTLIGPTYSWNGISDWQQIEGLNPRQANYYSPSTGQRSFRGGGGNAKPTQLIQQEDPFAGMYESMAAAMESQAAAQADYMAQMSELQAQALAQQEDAAKAANIESSKSAADFTVANADDVARKQMLRRGLMSTYTRYGGQNSGGGAPKATKLGG